MAYSRWCGSYWYTFWCVQWDGTVETRDNAKFDVNCQLLFTAKELRTDMERCLQDVRKVCERNLTEPTDEEMSELKEYMEEFLADVDERYPLTAAI